MNTALASSFPNSVWERLRAKLRFANSRDPRNGVSRTSVPKQSLGTRTVFVSALICVHLWFLPLIVAADPIAVGPPEKRSLVRTVEQPGRIEAFAQTPLLVRIAGYVKSVQADIGDRVKAGQVLAELD